MAENTTARTKAAKTQAPYDWREDMRKAGTLKDRAAGANKQASERLWKACQAGIEEWLPGIEDDAQGEALYNEFIDLYGESRKGDCSKMRTVALAVANNGLALDEFPNLSKAYSEAIRLTKKVKEEAVEDTAADEATTRIAAEAPKSSSKPEGAAMIVLAKGVDEAARLLLDALGEDNTEAHRSFLRAVSQEISGRQTAAKQAADEAKKAEREAEAKKKADEKAAKATALLEAKKTAKAKPAKKTATAKQKAASQVLKTKAEEAGVEPDPADGPEDDDDLDNILDEIGEDEKTSTPPKATPRKRAVPVKRPAR